MKISDIMSKDVKLITIDDSIRQAAKVMRENDIGSIPVQSDDRLQGMVTDRDITLWLADNSGDASSTPVSECMSKGITYCYEDDDIESVSQKMADKQIRRIPVLKTKNQYQPRFGLPACGRTPYSKNQVTQVSVGSPSRIGYSHVLVHDPGEVRPNNSFRLGTKYGVPQRGYQAPLIAGQVRRDEAAKGGKATDRPSPRPLGGVIA